MPSLSQLTVEQALQQAITHHQAGRLQDAEHLYRAILQLIPNHPNANHNLGVLALQMKQSTASLPYFKAALDANPSQAQFWISYIEALVQNGFIDEARQIVEQAKEQDLPEESMSALKTRVYNPSLEEINSIISLFGQGRYAECESLAHTLTVRFPHNGLSWKQLGAVILTQGRIQESLLPLKKAVELMPGDPEVHSNLGNTLKSLGRLNEAEESYLKALHLKPDLAEVYHNLGVTLRNMSRLDEAEENCRKAIHLKHGFADAYCVLGDILIDQDRCDEAIALYQKALDINPANIGLNAAVILAILHFLEGDFGRFESMIQVSRPITEKTEAKYRTCRLYWPYLNKLLLHNRQATIDKFQAQNMEMLYVIGESHSLSVHGTIVQYREREMQCMAEWIPGCKQWHLGNSQLNRYKHKFEAIMDRLPRSSTILLTIGEIDCRRDEGIIKAWEKSPEKPLDDIAYATVKGFVAYVSKISVGYGHQVIVGGVPAPNIMPNALMSDEDERLISLIRMVNKILKAQVLEAGMDFLDVYFFTDRGGWGCKWSMAH